MTSPLLESQLKCVKPCRKAGMVGGGVALVLLLVGAFVLREYFGPAAGASSEHAPATETAIHVHALGRLEPQSRVIRLAPPSSASGSRVERLTVREGDCVAAGALVAVLDTFDRLQAAVDEADAKLAVAQAKLLQLKAGAKPGEIAAQQAILARNETSVVWAEGEFRRAATLLAGRGISASDYEQKKSELEKARHEVLQARATLEAIREVRKVDVQVLEGEVCSAQAALKRARQDAETAQVRALVPGTVLKIHVFPGEVVGSKGIMELGNTEVMYAVAQVYEADIPRTRIGDLARVRVASSKKELDGIVEEIGRLVGRKDVLDNDPVSDTDARVVEVRIRLKADSSFPVASLSNARVEVTIMVSGK